MKCISICPAVCHEGVETTLGKRWHLLYASWINQERQNPCRGLSGHLAAQGPRNHCWKLVNLTVRTDKYCRQKNQAGGHLLIRCLIEVEAWFSLRAWSS